MFLLAHYAERSGASPESRDNGVNFKSLGSTDSHLTCVLMMVSDKRAITWTFQASQRIFRKRWNWWNHWRCTLFCRDCSVECTSGFVWLMICQNSDISSLGNFRTLKRCDCSLFQAKGTVCWWHVISYQCCSQLHWPWDWGNTGNMSCADASARAAVPNSDQVKWQQVQGKAELKTEGYECIWPATSAILKHG